MGRGSGIAPPGLMAGGAGGFSQYIIFFIVGLRFRVEGELADHLFEVAFDREADGGHGCVRGFVLEGVLEVDGHFFDEEEDGGDRNDDWDAHEAEEVDYGEG